MADKKDTATVTAQFTFYQGDALHSYADWPAPDVIISDGAYGIGGFCGDPTSAAELPDWYLPHIQAWSVRAKISTSLWFWNTEAGWAAVHPVLLSAGWEFVELCVWDNGLGHIAGNVNGKTIRQLPVVTEVSALYRRKLLLPDAAGGRIPAQQWLREEWQRSGLPLYQANEACGTANAATRKYLTAGPLWYFPPGEAVVRMAEYCRRYGKATVRPYFFLDGHTPVTAAQWDGLRAPWHHIHGLTNVWHRPPLADKERCKIPAGGKAALHFNQKPLDLMLLQLYVTSKALDIVWEPFGGLASASAAALQLGRYPCAAEADPVFAAAALQRLHREAKNFGCLQADVLPCTGCSD